MLGKHIEDYWNVDGDRELSDAWTGFRRFTTLSAKPPDGYIWSREETDKKANDLKAGHCMARNVEIYVWGIETQREAKVDNRETKTRKCERFAWYLTDPDDEESKRLMKNVRRKLEIPMPAAMPCRIQHSCGTVGRHKTKYAWSEADESTSIRMEVSQNKNHEVHVPGKGMNSLSRYNLLRNFSYAWSHEKTRCGAIMSKTR